MSLLTRPRIFGMILLGLPISGSVDLSSLRGVESYQASLVLHAWSVSTMASTT